jgi:dihydrofolate synthase/folylpolyglutamate synthase
VTESAALQDWLTAIEAGHPAEIQLGLERVTAVAGRMGLLPAPLPVVLIGGTNGKGSTLAFLEAALAAAGHRVGGYTSPHLFRFNERIRLGGQPVDDATLVAAFERVEAVRGGTPLTYFEFTTLAAMAVFADSADLALLEVGLGGRLDAVNIWDPAVSVITSVDLDHQAFLGNDRETIGREKAGILRPGVAAVCGDPDPPRSVIVAAGDDLLAIGRAFRAEAGEEGWYWAGGNDRLGPLPRPLLTGDYQLRNAATAIAAGQQLPPEWRPDPAAWRQALAATLIPGRGQTVPGPVPVWLDVAHNPQAAGEFAALLAQEPVKGRTLAVFGAMRDKAVAELCAAMAGVVDRWYPCGMPGDRALSGTELAAMLPPAAVAESAADPRRALAAARADARPGYDRIAVFGSFLLVADVLAALEEGMDSPQQTGKGRDVQ